MQAKGPHPTLETELAFEDGNPSGRKITPVPTIAWFEAVLSSNE
jgi:hypothetical protein